MIELEIEDRVKTITKRGKNGYYQELTLYALFTFFNIGTWFIGGREKNRGLELIVNPISNLPGGGNGTSSIKLTIALIKIYI